jgi:transcriptional regulator with XRE-family HTH domain
MKTLTIAQVLRQTRSLYGFTLEYVADYLDITTEAYRKKELGLTEPKYSNLMKLSELYKISINDLITFNKEVMAQQIVKKFEV